MALVTQRKKKVKRQVSLAVQWKKKGEQADGSLKKNKGGQTVRLSGKKKKESWSDRYI